MNRPQTARALATLAVAALTIAACGSSSSDDESATADETTSTSTAGTSTASTRATSTRATSTSTASTADGQDTTAESEGELFPDVLNASARLDDDGTWSFDATLSSPYDSAQRYADAWRVVGADGTEYGIRVLLHDHASEQPFTRSQSGIAIPDDVDKVTVQGRDQISGWGGQSVVVELDRG